MTLIAEGAPAVETPAKAEVRFRDGIGVERAIEEGVRRALQPLDSTPSLGARPAAAADGRCCQQPPDLHLRVQWRGR